MQLIISIPSETDNLYRVENFIESVTTAFNLPPELFDRISSSIIKAFTYSVKYANRGDITKMVRIVAKKEENQLKVTVNNEGYGFDFDSIPDPTLPENIDNKSIHTLFSIKTLSDDFIFEQYRTWLTIVFNLPIPNFRSIILQSLSSFYPSELIKINKLSTTKQLDVAILFKSNHSVEIEDLVYSLPHQLHLGGILFYRIAVSILEVVWRIKTDTNRNHREGVDKRINICIKRMRTKIEVTIYYGEEPFRSPWHFYSSYYSKRYSNKISYAKHETELKIIFNRWTKKNLQSYYL